MIIIAKVWSSYLPYDKTAKNITPFEGLYCGIIPWLGRWLLVQTPSDSEKEKLEDEIREMRSLMYEEEADE